MIPPQPPPRKERGKLHILDNSMSTRDIVKYSLMKLSSLIHRNRESKILYYHDVFETKNYKALDAHAYMGTPLSLFKQHIETIRKAGFEIVKEITQPVGQVSIMFDDGFRGIWECRQYFYIEKIFPTIFLPVAYVGKVEDGMLSVDEILELQANGFKFECHGWSHRPFTGVADEELDKELKDSKRKLSEILNKEVSEICMPLGFFNDKIIQRIKEAGYKRFYSCIPGTFNKAPQGLMARNICQFATPAEVKLILTGGNDLLKKRYESLHRK